MSASADLHLLMLARNIEYSYSITETMTGYRHDTDWWTSDGSRCEYIEIVDRGDLPYTKLVIYQPTPEEAIAATTAAVTCHDEGDERIFHCSECGCAIMDIYLRNEEECFYCDGDQGGEKWPRYCPHCGARVAYE